MDLAVITKTQYRMTYLYPLQHDTDKETYWDVVCVQKHNSSFIMNVLFMQPLIFTLQKVLNAPLRGSDFEVLLVLLYCHGVSKLGNFKILTTEKNIYFVSVHECLN